MEYVEKNKYYLMLIGLCLILFTICIIQGQKLKEYRNGGPTYSIDSTVFDVDTMATIDTTAAVNTEISNTGDYPTWSIAELETKAREGDAEAQSWLGKKYFDIQDYDNAMSWCLKADKQGNSAAQTTIGYMYQESLGVTQNYDTAMQWYLKANEQGDANAQVNIGALYFYGKGVDPDKEIAKQWFLKAAKQGNEAATNWLKEKYGITN
jgi:tetratricopeptide (TPR) repeat protein